MLSKQQDLSMQSYKSVKAADVAAAAGLLRKAPTKKLSGNLQIHTRQALVVKPVNTLSTQNKVNIEKVYPVS